MSLSHGDQIAIVTCLTGPEGDRRSNTLTLLVEAPIEFHVQVLARNKYTALGGDHGAPRKDD